MVLLEPPKPVDQRLVLAIQLNEDQRGLVTLSDEISGTIVALGTLNMEPEPPDLDAWERLTPLLSASGIDTAPFLSVVALARRQVAADREVTHRAAEGLAAHPRLSCVANGAWTREEFREWVPAAGVIPAELMVKA